MPVAPTQVQTPSLEDTTTATASSKVSVFRQVC